MLGSGRSHWQVWLKLQMGARPNLDPLPPSPPRSMITHSKTTLLTLCLMLSASSLLLRAPPSLVGRSLVPGSQGPSVARSVTRQDLDACDLDACLWGPLCSPQPPHP